MVWCCSVTDMLKVFQRMTLKAGAHTGGTASGALMERGSKAGWWHVPKCCYLQVGKEGEVWEREWGFSDNEDKGQGEGKVIQCWESNEEPKGEKAERGNELCGLGELGTLVPSQRLSLSEMHRERGREEEPSERRKTRKAEVKRSGEGRPAVGGTPAAGPGGEMQERGGSWSLEVGWWAVWGSSRRGHKGALKVLGNLTI